MKEKEIVVLRKHNCKKENELTTTKTKEKKKAHD
jgi:hypothetical protein